MVSGGVSALVVLALLTTTALATSSQEYSRAVIESCRGCQLNRLPDVKSFIFEDVPHYENVEFRHVQGNPPELVLYNNQEEEVKRIKLAALNRKECNDLLVAKGFKKSKTKDEM